jgi:multidrug efflux system membrane fusion protein
MPVRRLLLPLLILVVTVALVAALMATRPRLAVVEQPEQVWPVEVLTATHATHQPELRLFGEIVAGRRSELRALVAGPVVALGKGFHEGGAVRAGDLLLQVDPFEYETALADQLALETEARASLAVLRRDLARAEELYGASNVSEQFLDNARLQVIRQESLVEQRGIHVARARRALADARLMAPYDGVLAGVSANLGKRIAVNDKVADIVDTATLEVRFIISNAQYGRLLGDGNSLVGRAVEVTWNLGDRALRFPARIERLGAEITAASGGVPVFAEVDTGGEQSALRPGVFVQVLLPDRRYERVLEAPDTALYGADRIYVVEDERLAERRIVIHGYSGSTLYFTGHEATPIRDGDRIVVTQLREAGTGARVLIR